MKHQIKGLQVIINTQPAPVIPSVVLAEKVIAGGVDSLQFRHKGPYTRDIFDEAKCISELCRCHQVPFIIDDRFDIAVAVNASGVHLGQNDIEIHIARKFLGDEKLIGATASSLEQAKAAEEDGADYIGLGHIFPTKTKVKDTQPLGLEAVVHVCAHVKIPVLAIGGINEWNLADVCAAGPQGVAVISSICSSPDPRRQTLKFKNILKDYVESMH